MIVNILRHAKIKYRVLTSNGADKTRHPYEATKDIITDARNPPPVMDIFDTTKQKERAPKPKQHNLNSRAYF